MDIRSYRQLQDSAWVREQRDRLARNQPATCPVRECHGRLEAYDIGDELEITGDAIPRPGGVRCVSCGARSRPVAL